MTDLAAIRELAERTRHWGLDQERPNDVLLEDGSGRLILRGFHAPKGSWSGWPSPWYARDAVELAKAVRTLLALLADTPSVEVDDGDGGRWKGIDGEGRAIRPSVEPAGLAEVQSALSWALGRIDKHPLTASELLDYEAAAALLPTQASDSPEKP